MKILGIIPARYASSRFPAKVLADIAGKTMIRRVYEQAAASKILQKIIVATDHPDIASEVQRFGGEVVMTGSQHQSGTDRCFEAFVKLGESYDYIINVQGDEPFIDPSQIDLLSHCLKDGSTELATLVIKVSELAQLQDSGEAKVVLNTQGEAIYFSRQAIPFLRNVPYEQWLDHHTFYRHVGIYAYRADILAQITRLQPTLLEQCESLEQLRWLEHGFKIRAVETTRDSLCIETPEDLARAVELMREKGNL